MKEGGRGAFSKATDVGKVCVNAAGGGRGGGGKVSRAEMKTDGEEVEAMCAEASAGEFLTFLCCSSDDQPAPFSPPRVKTRGFGSIGSDIFTRLNDLFFTLNFSCRSLSKGEE